MTNYRLNIENQDFRLMIWETDPNKRNENNIVKFNIKDKFDVEELDVLTIDGSDGENSNYEILEIIESRNSTIKGYKYITAKTNWFRN
jgi:hypothetical protein